MVWIGVQELTYLLDTIFDNVLDRWINLSLDSSDATSSCEASDGRLV